MRTTPRRVAELKRTYQSIQRLDPGESAPLEEQHQFWRLHDRAKRAYAVADWQWESLVLRVLIAAVVVIGIASMFITELTAAGILVMAVALWRCYRIFTRSAPD